MNRKILLFNSSQTLLGEIKIIDGHITADIIKEKFSYGYDEFLEFITQLKNTPLYKKEKKKINGIIFINKNKALDDKDKIIAFSESISRNNFSFGRIFAVASPCNTTEVI